ncbi:prepilin-type N-terminal cleavage/methylation domain-containing protein [Thalassotalea psychrophila]|uniref:Prepilin-type N-terminal cleavage/methylation domain-containing protein n=1 Tax=Thalassotalea psychrophila TaxID=3065647 RepID=A0ABY9TUI2_9GAMM|nr:prepilin-type N-terminal cleavage/methylation domain-containing protein [Colwelliaceae bacterium SQ149]
MHKARFTPHNLCSYRTTKSLSSGFTLIEMIIVIVILAVLAAVAAPKFIDLTKSADQAVMKAQIASVAAARDLVTVQLTLHPENLNANKSRFTLKSGQRIRIRGGYADGRWNNTFVHLVDVSKVGQVGTNDCDAEELDFCVRHRNSGWFRNRGFADNASRGRGFVIYPQGYNLNSTKCYTFYYTPNDSVTPTNPEKPITGSDFSEC